MCFTKQAGLAKVKTAKHSLCMCVLRSLWFFIFEHNDIACVLFQRLLQDTAYMNLLSNSILSSESALYISIVW